MYDLAKYIPAELELFEPERVEIPSFSTLAEKADYKMELEMMKGKGMNRNFPYPVPLEPPYEDYEHTRLSEIDKHFLGQGDYSPVRYPEYHLVHIRALLNDEVQPQHILSMLIALTGEQHISFEIVRYKEEIKLYFTLPDFLKDTLLSQLYTFFPKSQFEIADHDPILDVDERGYRANYLEYALLSSNIYPLKKIEDPNVLTYLIGLLEETEGIGILQIMLKRCWGAWERNYDLCLRDRYTFERFKFKDLDIEEILEEKNKPPYFAVIIRTGFTTKETCYRLHRFLTAFNSTYQQLIPLMPDDNIIDDFEYRYSHHYGMLLSAEETVNLVYLPIQIEGSIKFKKIEFVQMPGPDKYVEGILIGVNEFRNKRTEVKVSQDLLCRHLLIGGATGTGKSTLLRNMALSAIDEGLGLAVFDIKGDLAEGVLKLVPSERVEDTFYVNPQDRENPVALNILKFKELRSPYDLTQDLIAIIDKTTGGRADPLTARMIRYLRRALLTILRLPDTNIPDVSHFLEDEDFRNGIVGLINDRELTKFWKRFNIERKRFGYDVSVDGIINRLDQFVSDDIVGNMLGQRELALDFLDIVNSNKILIVNLANIGEDRISVLGTLLLTELMLAGLQKPLESEKLFLIFADEFSFYHTPTLTQILRLGRAYKLGLVLSHQNVEDLPPELEAAAFGNIATTVAFRVGSSYATKLSFHFGAKIEGVDFIKTPLYKTYIKRETDVFTMDTLPPPEIDREQADLIIERSREKLTPKPEIYREKDEWEGVEWIEPLITEEPPDKI